MAKKPLKIGYIWQYEASGLSPVAATALHIQGVVRSFERLGHQVRIVAFRDGVPHYSDDLQTWHPIHSTAGSTPAFRAVERVLRGVQSRLRLPYLRFFESYRFSQACRQVLQGYDIFYERFWLMNYGGLMAAERLGGPLVYEVNGDLVEEYSMLGIELSRSQWSAIHFITRRMFQRAGRVVAVSRPLREVIISRWRLDPDQVVAVPNGAQVDLFAQGQASPELVQRWGLDGGPVVMFVGSFKPWHGLDLLVEAFASVAAAHPTARLVLVGDGLMRADLEAQARKLGLEDRIIFTGAVPHDEVAALLQSAQVAIVNPRLSPVSRSSGPLKLFEYMAAGKAVVAPAIDGVRQVLVDGVDGKLIAPDSPQALAAALQELLADEDLRLRLGQAARKKALDLYSWDSTVAQIEAIFEQELARRQSNPGRATALPSNDLPEAS